MRVVNKSHGFPPTYGTGEANVSVDRGSDWGNPFVMHDKTQAERDRVCDAYELYAKWRLTIEPDWLVPLRGKNLACHCAPLRCHAETLIRLANQEQPA